MKLKPLWLIPLLSITLASCASDADIAFSDDEPFTIELSVPHLRVLQVTDLHLTHGIDRNDQRTFELIEALAAYTEPDIIAITGDQTMSPLAPSLYRRLARRVDAIGIPWTFVFGNHDSDFNSYKRNLDVLEAMNLENLLFKVGPQLTDGGFGNFIIETIYDDAPFHNLYFLDTKNENGALMEYDWLSEAQVAWYEDHIEVDAITDVTSSVYMHIPLLQYEEYLDYDYEGVMGEDKVYAQGMDTGFFAAMVAGGLSKGVFVGHDHLSNFSFIKDGIMLAYGQTSGYNGYGQIARGGRIIDIDASGALTSYIVLDTEVGV